MYSPPQNKSGYLIVLVGCSKVKNLIYRVLWRVCERESTFISRAVSLSPVYREIF